MEYTFYCIAGHSLSDPGAIGVGGAKEATQTMKFRDLVYDITLKKIVSQKIPMSIVKDDDRDNLGTVISKISPIIKSSDLILDIHFNAGPPTATGMECVVSDNASYRSINIAEEILKVGPVILGIKNRGLKREKDTPRKRLGMLRMKGAAVIIELSFISNQYDQNAIVEFQHWLSDYISDIVIEDAKKQLGITK